MGSERNTKKLQRTVAVFGPSPRFDDEPDALNGYFPGLVVRPSSVGYGALRPTLSPRGSAAEGSSV